MNYLRRKIWKYRTAARLACEIDEQHPELSKMEKTRLLRQRFALEDIKRRGLKASDL